MTVRSHCSSGMPGAGMAGDPAAFADAGTAAGVPELAETSTGSAAERGVPSDRCSISSVGPRLQSTARSITWLSSRTLPGQGYYDHGQPEVEVAAELVTLGIALEVAVGGGQDSHIDPAVPDAAHPPHR